MRGRERIADLHEDPFGWKRLRYIRTVEESKALNGLGRYAVHCDCRVRDVREAGRACCII